MRSGILSLLAYFDHDALPCRVPLAHLFLKLYIGAGTRPPRCTNRLLSPWF
jgi:hypothetical protein